VDRGTGPALVFLHEGLGSIGQWRDFPAQGGATPPAAARWSTTVTATAIQRAEGEARVGVEFMHEGALNELPELLRKFKIENPILVGHSDGARSRLIHAGTYPVRGVVTWRRTSRSSRST
jgi:pimeloyl-ACP methyl ester carboxylesterase